MSSLPTPPSQEIYRDPSAVEGGLRLETVPEGERVTLIKGPDDTQRVCSPRESDEGLSASTGFSLSIPTGGGSAGFDETAGDDAIALGSPTQLAQLAREFLFRACELSMNLNADAEQTLAIYERFLTSLERIAPALQSTDDADQSASDDGSDDEE